MSEWVDDGCRGAERDYTETHGELAVSAFATGVSQAWCAGSRVPSDQSPTSLEGARAAGEEALVAWVLIALARRAAAWAEGIDAGSAAGLLQIATRAGLDQAFVEAALADQGWRQQAEANRAEMLALGLWGVPSFRVDQCPAHWGQDRLWLIERDLIEATAATTQ